MSDPEVVVIGAGLALAQLGISCLILESRQRVGGRAYTDTASAGGVWDHVCYWFHSADVNVLRRIAEAIGHGFEAPDAPVNVELNPFGRPIAVAHVGGSTAQGLAAEGPAALQDFALGALVRAFGGYLRRRVTAAATTGRTADPWIGGAYSAAAPGAGHLRRHFSEPLHGRVFFAGEHVHDTFMATAHGAFETGLAAARRAAALPGRDRSDFDPAWLPADGSWTSR